MNLQKRYLFCSFLLAALIASTTSYASIPHVANPTGYVLDPDSHSKVIYHFYKSSEESEGRRIVQAWYRDQEGKDAVTQKAVYQGDQFLSYSLEQHQVGEIAQAEVRDGKLVFTTSRAGETTQIERDLEPNTYVIDQLPDLLRRNWQKVSTGGTVQFNLVVVSRSRTVGFEFSKESDTQINGRDALVIKMKPSNFLIALLVKPIFLTFSKQESHELIESRGWLPVKRRDGDSWKDLEARLVFKQ